MSVSHNVVKVPNVEIFYREAGKNQSNPAGTFLLFHGMSFSSANWEEISTLAKLSQWNFRAIAVDLPGYGNSKAVPEPNNKASFVSDLCEALNIKKPIIISPSMSGMYSLPYVHENWRNIGGYIPIAPVTTKNYTNDQYKQIKAPTFIVYGENDARLGESSLNHLKNIPGSKIMKIANAGHACYLNQTETWHNYLKEILKDLEQNAV